MKKPIITFKPKQAVKELLSPLSTRAQDIMKRRYGLGADTKHQTLESIGTTYGITRERVRQIENFSLATIRRSDEFRQNEAVFMELRDVMKEYGGIIRESDFLEYLSTDKSYQNYIHFVLVVGDYFERLREDDDFHHRWTVDKTLALKVEEALQFLHKELKETDLVSEKEMIERFIKHLKKDPHDIKDSNVARRWLSLSKKIGKNPLGDWGVSHSPNIKARGIRDLAYLILRDHGSPMHFREVAKRIEEKFEKKAHQATVHNELIKDRRFVLVGRGLYALAEWGYKPGIVRSVIKEILQSTGPLKREEVVERVLKERHVKENTILVNLQNSKHFRKDKNGRYSLVS